MCVGSDNVLPDN